MSYSISFQVINLSPLVYILLNIKCVVCLILFHSKTYILCMDYISHMKYDKKTKYIKCVVLSYFISFQDIHSMHGLYFSYEIRQKDKIYILLICSLVVFYFNPRHIHVMYGLYFSYEIRHKDKIYIIIVQSCRILFHSKTYMYYVWIIFLI